MTRPTATIRALQEAIEYAPSSGPTAPDLLGLWVPDPDLGLKRYLCAECVGRITARGCGHLLRECERSWRGGDTPEGVCCLCTATPASGAR